MNSTQIKNVETMKTNNKFKFISRLTEKHEVGIALALLLLIVFFSISSQSFFTFDNLINIAYQSSMVFIIAVGMTIIIILGGMDLSAGYVAGLAGMVTTGFLSAGRGLFLSILAGLLVGALIGAFNGILITKIGITDFIVTLSTMSVAHGLIFAYSKGYPIYKNLSKEFQFIGQGHIFSIPVPIIIALFFFLFGHLFLTRFRIGTYVYATGGNKESSRLSGINVDRVKIVGYIVCGTLAAVAGIIMSSRLGSGQPTAGDGFLFAAIGASVLGGTSLMGGEGKIVGTLIGVFIMAVISNGLTLLNVPFYYQEVISGLIIILAVAYNSYRAKVNG